MRHRLSFVESMDTLVSTGTINLFRVPRIGKLEAQWGALDMSAIGR